VCDRYACRSPFQELKEVFLIPIIFLKVKVINPEHPKKMKESEFLLDSGAVYSVVPQSVLKSLGIKPTSFEEFILANREIIRRPIGNADFEYQGKVRTAPVVFGDKSGSGLI
jgi:predicted aspartyl protease